MQFSSVLLAAATIAAANAAKFGMGPAYFQTPYTAGTSVMNITWSDADGDATILLKNGVATDLKTVLTIACKKYGSRADGLANQDQLD